MHLAMSSTPEKIKRFDKLKGIKKSSQSTEENISIQATQIKCFLVWQA